MKKILLVTDGIFHPPFTARLALRKALAAQSAFEFHYARSMEELPDNLEEISALVIYLHHQKISENALTRLDLYVSNGGGILGIHTATAAYKEHIRYFEILGGRFIGHGPIEKFEVKRVNDELFYGIRDFVVKDELYMHEFQPGITPHFIAFHQGQEVPVVWTYFYGQGRVCYAVPGHTTATMRNRSYQMVLQRGLTWVCKE